MNQFKCWFAALNDSHEPFPWQEDLFEKAMRGEWPRLIQLPTASGKTALIDIAVLALGANAPGACRRIAFVIDRRVVVDEAAERSRVIAERLREARDRPSKCLYPIAKRLCELAGNEDPLVIATLRGGIQPDDSWARSPSQPAVILSTVDQVGSRLLFRGYGDCGPRSWPIHAGLIGMDCLLIIDEAHCSQPFCETVRLIADKYQSWAELPLCRPLRVVQMSATPGEQPDFELKDKDYSHPDLGRRITVAKPAELIIVDANQENDRECLVKEMVQQAKQFLDLPRVVGIVVNRVADARAIFRQLTLHESQKVLLTGRVRG